MQTILVEGRQGSGKSIFVAKPLVAWLSASNRKVVWFEDPTQEKLKEALSTQPDFLVIETNTNIDALGIAVDLIITVEQGKS